MGGQHDWDRRLEGEREREPLEGKKADRTGEYGQEERTRGQGEQRPGQAKKQQPRKEGSVQLRHKNTHTINTFSGRVAARGFLNKKQQQTVVWSPLPLTNETGLGGSCGL